MKDIKLYITASIVLYKNKREILLKAIESLLDSPLQIKLFMVDNSPTNELKNIIEDPRVEYIFNNNNLGFGKAHNIAIKKSMELGCRYHLVLNPDVYFNAGVLEELVEVMDKDATIGQIMPKVLYPNGDTQYLCKLLPSPFDLFLRRFLKIQSLQKKWND